MVRGSRQKEHNVRRVKEHNVPFALLRRLPPVALVDQPLDRRRVDLRKRTVNFEQQLDRARDRSFAVQPAAQRDRLNVQKGRQFLIGPVLRVRAISTVFYNVTEPGGRHG